MDSKLTTALLLMAVMVIVLIFNYKGDVDVNLVFTKVKDCMASLVFFAFLGIGVVIGIMLK